MAALHVPGADKVRGAFGYSLRFAAVAMDAGARVASLAASTLAGVSSEDIPNRSGHLAEGRAAFEEAAWANLGISGEEFLRRWDEGEYPNPDDRPEVMRVAMLLPLAG